MPSPSPAEIRLLTTMPEIVAASALTQSIWGQASGLPTNMIRAIQHADGYVAGAFAGDVLIGTSVAIRGRIDGTEVLHSHITGVIRPGQGVGTALKQHQRAWCQDRGIPVVTWTFDPLVARNGWFNIAKLGAVGRAYLPDHYGAMDDPINRGDATDRLLAWWPAAPATPTPPPATGQAVGLLHNDADGQPLSAGSDCDGTAAAYAVAVPDDIDTLRATAPERARQWRLAVRHAMTAATGQGYAVTHMTRDGVYLLTPAPRMLT